jgi:hypothetical protein
MPFDWYHPDLPDDYTMSPLKATQMYTLELKERAALLMRLGYSKEETLKRVVGNVRWDFELHPEPAHLEQARQVVDEVYRTRSSGASGPPSL